METILSTHNLSKTYGTSRAVDNLSLTVRRGDIYGFLGPNGAGKTTTLRMITGLIRPTGGAIELLGQDLAGAPRSLMARLGCLIEGPASYGHLSAAENLRIVQKLKRSDRPGEIADLLRLVDLADTGHKRVKDFSLGMRQRLGLAQAMVGSPELLILDEPTNGLDPAGIRAMRDLLHRLVQERGLTIILSSHLLSEVELVASRVGVIRSGRLLIEASVDELRRAASAGLEVAVSHPDQAATLLRERLGARVEPLEQGRLLVQGDVQPASVAALLVRHDLQLSHLARRASSLESIFFDLTGGGTHA